MSYTITTTMQPAIEVVVSDAEYLDLLRQGVINTATPGGVDGADEEPAWAGPAGPVHFVDAVQIDGLSTLTTVTTRGVSDTPEDFPMGVGSAPHTGVNILSSFDGGEDEGDVGQFDSTGRLNLYSYQRADVGSYGENIRRFLMRDNAKSMDAWYMARQNGAMTQGYNGSGDPDADASWVPVAWIGAHWKANDGLSVHGHWSVEVPDSTGAVQTRFEVPFTDQEVADGSKELGVDVTNIRTNLADFTVRANLGAYGTGALRVGGGNAVNKDLLLSISADRATTGRRWAVRANTTTEAGSNAGTDFQVVAFSDTGVEIAARIHVARSTGNVGFGTTSVSGGKVTAAWSTSGLHGYYAVPSASPGSGAAFAHDAQATTDRSVQLKVSGDANSRLVGYADGKLEWGDGAASRDTNLYRSAANVLKTDDSLHVALDLRHLGTNLGFYNATAVAKQTITGSRGGNAALADLLTKLATLGLITDSTSA